MNAKCGFSPPGVRVEWFIRFWSVRFQAILERWRSTRLGVRQRRRLVQSDLFCGFFVMIDGLRPRMAGVVLTSEPS